MIKLLIFILPILINIFIVTTNMNNETLVPESTIMCILNPDSTQMLLLERNPDYETNKDRKHELELPGGKIEGSETYEKCVERELWEETSLCLDRVEESREILTKTPEETGRMIFVYTLNDNEMSKIEQARQDMKVKLHNNVSKCAGLNLHWINVDSLKHSVKTKNITLALDEKFSLPLRKFNMFVLKDVFNVV